MGSASVRRVDFGYFVRPAAETETGKLRVEPCLGYVIDHAQGRLLFDTGLELILRSTLITGHAGSSCPPRSAQLS